MREAVLGWPLGFMWFQVDIGMSFCRPLHIYCYGTGPECPLWWLQTLTAPQ